MRGWYSGSVYVQWEVFHLAVMQSAKYNITKVVELCDLCVCSVPLRRKSPALLFISPLSLSDRHLLYFFEHVTCLWKLGASVKGLMKRAAASLGAPGQPGWHVLTTGFESAGDIYSGTFSVVATFKNTSICSGSHRGLYE